MATDPGRHATDNVSGATPMVARVCPDIRGGVLKDTYDYLVPSGLPVDVGSRVKIPFGRRKVQGFVTELTSSSDVPPERLRNLESVLDPSPILTPEDFELARFLSSTYRTDLGSAIRLLLPAKLRSGKRPLRPSSTVELNIEPRDWEAAIATLMKKDGSPRYPQQIEVLTRLREAPSGIPAAELPVSTLRTLRKKNFVKISERPPAFDFSSCTGDTPIEEVRLEKQQRKALDAFLGGPGSASGFLLHGVTGSGKTEVYIRVIRNLLAQGKGAILLVPEISLTPQAYRYLAQRLDAEVALFHSQLSEGERFAQWMRVRTGNARVVLGPRSAVFAPVRNLGGIIIDEEHESSYRSGRHPAYHAKEVAEFRTRKGGTLILGSATPSVETYTEMRKGKWKLVEMKERILHRPLPSVEIVDMRQEVGNGNTGLISGPLDRAIREALSENRQIMLLLNRRGYSPSLVCPACGHVPHCSQCDVSLSYHKHEGMLKCHYCGKREPLPDACPVCGTGLRRLGAGTQRLEEYLHTAYPSARILRMDADTMSRRNAHQEAYDRFLAGDADILIGTQMIAKGFDFERVQVAAVISADTMLHLPDYRSAERTFAQITQLAGRAGRKAAGQVFVQTYTPDHYVFSHAARHDFKGFYREEMEYRRSTRLPPCGQYIVVRFTSDSEQACREEAKRYMARMTFALEPYRGNLILARASESPIRRIQGAYRYQILLHLREPDERMVGELFDLLDPRGCKDVYVNIDSNPSEMY